MAVVRRIHQGQQRVERRAYRTPTEAAPATAVIKLCRHPLKKAVVVLTVLWGVASFHSKWYPPMVLSRLQARMAAGDC